jgi:hypothetical protein
VSETGHNYITTGKEQLAYSLERPTLLKKHKVGLEGLTDFI